MEGDLEKDGFVAFNSNYSSNDDAFAISANHKLFAVSDGVSSHAKSNLVSRFITKKIAEEIINLDQVTPSWIESKLKELSLEKTWNKEFPDSRGSATLALVNQISDQEFQIKLLGDSPLYVIDKNGKITHEYGTETSGDEITPGFLGIKEDNRAIVSGDFISKTIKIGPGERIVFGSDYLSDGLNTGRNKAKKFIEWSEDTKPEGSYLVNGKSHVWDAADDKRLNNAKEYIRLYDEILKDPEYWKKEFLNNYSKYRSVRAMWNLDVDYIKKIEARNLNEFATIKSAEEFHNKVSGDYKWKYDDATVVIIDPSKLN